MKLCVSQKQMQELEYDSMINIGIPSLVLMERAALAVVDCVVENVDKSAHISIVCGKGNNGADGIAVARMLYQQGYQVEVVTIGERSKATKEYEIQEKIAERIGVVSIEWSSWMPQEEGWVIDGVFGIGLKREVQGAYGELIEKMQGSRVISIDIPSGISADTGEVLGCGVRAVHTVTFGYGKRGLYLNQGRSYAGEIHIADIGFHSGSIQAVEGVKAKIIEEKDLSVIPKRKEDGHKGTYGRLLIIAGSVGMSGAAYLCALAAYRMGAGLVKVLTVEENREILQMQLPEAIVKGYTNLDMEAVVEAECDWASAIVMGPGLGQESYVKELVEMVLRKGQQKPCPMVLDSDALNTIANEPRLRAYYGSNIVITPHMKEMSRLTQQSIAELKKDGITFAMDYSSENQVVCLLKDAVSVITDNKNLYLTLSGNSALAKGGTGDVLAGMVGGLMCLGMSAIEAAAYGSYLHGRAGTLASKVRGKHGVLARDLMEYIYLS